MKKILSVYWCFVLNLSADTVFWCPSVCFGHPDPQGLALGSKTPFLNIFIKSQHSDNLLRKMIMFTQIDCSLTVPGFKWLWWQKLCSREWLVSIVERNSQHPDSLKSSLSVMPHASFSKPLHFSTRISISSCCLRLHILVLRTLKSEGWIGVELSK